MAGIKQNYSYLSTLPAGFQEPVKHFMETSLPGFVCQKLEDGMLVYSCAATSEEIANIPYVSNSFLVLFSIKAKLLEPLAAVVCHLNKAGVAEQALKAISGRGKTFRIMGFQGNEPTQLPNKDLTRLEALIAAKTGMRVSRAGAQTEFWCYSRRAGGTYFMQRLTKRQSSEKSRLPGELSPEIAKILCLLSDPCADDVFLDPFCGHGAIPLARVVMPHRMIFAGDSNTMMVSSLRRRIKDSAKSKQDPLRKIIFYTGNALDLARFETNFVTKIVTDPPWGLYASTEIPLPEFYRSFLEAASRVLTPSGSLVLLSAQKELVASLTIEIGFKIEERYDVLISGKKAAAFKMSLAKN
jgi:predicted RNA methylase